MYSDEPWQQMQLGKITERDYWLYRAEETGKLIGEDWHSMKVMVQRARGSTPDEIIRPEFLIAYERVKAAGKRLSILSNMECESGCGRCDCTARILYADGSGSM